VAGYLRRNAGTRVGGYHLEKVDDTQSAGRLVAQYKLNNSNDPTKKEAKKAAKEKAAKAAAGAAVDGLDLNFR